MAAFRFGVEVTLAQRLIPGPPPIPTPPVTASAPKVEHGDRQCPKCNSHYVYGSKSRTWFEGQLNRFHIPLYRCYRCCYRYCVVRRTHFARKSFLD